ncbi:uncharacterized protein LOC122260027 [Penaeus japonicus]|uniref:uncharacterized protein LOC122260027 n=1 Tax=Penaeus japonicus TaxID=27405 RepID=UPI001C71309B|nr:uncharacterized protein LOC122260027 [Penaeus japonicus]
MDCKVCLDKFNEEDKRPRYIPCGHTFCSFCLSNLFRNGSVSCPTCRAKHTASDVAQFPIAYLVEELIKNCNVRRTLETAGPATSPSEPNAKKGISKKLTSLREEQRDSIDNLEDTCESVFTELAMYKGSLSHWQSEHDKFVDKIAKIMIEPNEEIRRALADERKSLEDVWEEGLARQREMDSALVTLCKAETAQQVVTAIDIADQRQTATEAWIEKCREDLPNITAAHKSNKIRLLFKKALEIITEGMADGSCAPMHLSGSRYTVPQKVTFIRELASVKITVDSLRRPNGSVKSLLEAGVVFAVKKDEAGKDFFAKITLKNNKTFLHHLSDVSPSTNVYTLPYDEIKSEMNTSNVLTFLDLTWPGSTEQRRVHIRLSPESARGRHFIVMCTGEQGSSLADTNFQKVLRKGGPGELVMAGSYSCVKGSAILPNGDKYRRKATAGVVFGVPHWDKVWDARYYGVFHIATRDCPSSYYYTAFGQVESGLEVLVAAANLDDITCVKIVECGVVL